ncbi:MAG: hypothetical protein DESF_00907 [Desulfovibrio sp.]
MDTHTPAAHAGHDTLGTTDTPGTRDTQMATAMPSYSPAHSLPALRKRRRTAPALPPPEYSGRLLVRLAPQHTALFRFLLEAYDHTAYFTVIEPKTALLKIIFSPHLEKETRLLLAEMSASLPFEQLEWPFDTGRRGAKML